MQCSDCTPSTSCLAHQVLPTSEATLRTPSPAEDHTLQSNDSPRGLESGPQDATKTEESHQLEDGDTAVPDPAKSPRIIISFPRGDPENPYNWSTVGVVRCHE